MSTHTSKWDLRFLELAHCVSTWSKDPSTQVGAVIVRPDKTIASVGFNGFAKHTPDFTGLYANKQEKYSRIIHAEMNALLFCKEKSEGCTMYIFPFLCCDRCAVHIIQAGIRKVVAPKAVMHTRPEWQASWDNAQKYLYEAGVLLELL